MRLVVAVASRYGATAEIAQAVGDTLAAAGHDVDVRPVAEVRALGDYEAAVIGSAVYAGHWLDQAKDFVAAHREALRAKPVWLFSSGPIGEPPKPEEDPVDVADLVDGTGAIEHRLFAGKLDRKQLRFAERAIVRALRAPEGDFRDWEEIRAWATAIARHLEAG